MEQPRQKAIVRIDNIEKRSLEILFKVNEDGFYITV